MVDERNASESKGRRKFAFVDDFASPTTPSPKSESPPDEEGRDDLQEDSRPQREDLEDIGLTAKIKKDLEKKKQQKPAKKAVGSAAARIKKRLAQELFREQEAEEPRDAEAPRKRKAEVGKDKARQYWDEILSPTAKEEPVSDRQQRIKWLKDLANKEQIGLTAKIAKSLAKYSFPEGDDSQADGDYPQEGGGGIPLFLLLFIIAIGALLFGIAIDTLLSG